MSLIKELAVLRQQWHSGVISGQEFAVYSDRIIQQAESVEPVAWAYSSDQISMPVTLALCPMDKVPDGTPLYLHPPLRRDEDAKPVAWQFVDQPTVVETEHRDYHSGDEWTPLYESPPLHPDASELVEALSKINQYGADTLSGNAEGKSDSKWYRRGVAHMTNTALEALANWESRDE